MKVASLSSTAPCPCGSGQSYAACCAVWHDGWNQGIDPPDPQVLMRARYSAYVLARVDYLLATWHPDTVPGELELAPVKWLGLEVRDSQASVDAGVVEFVARYRDRGRGVRMHEISRFVRENGRWLYVDGQQRLGDPPQPA
ncbi:MAG: YchJ family protein [Rhodoferax sp.]|uniref:YchJ family protein n=1 Tax=Rhodoferax sp. TaxID=50421 RepID=UPI001B45F0AB|nr:YchJ family protein [Rhodoferax sp.]MBP9904848.1 YchJ family protein [Rhodoferax sp.]